MTVSAVLAALALAAGSAQVAGNGYRFFMFRQGGTGSTAGSVTDQQFLARQDAPVRTVSAVHQAARGWPVPRWHAYLHALGQAGCWYSWGGAGPCSRGFDCSGLAVAAYASVGIWLPHNTGAMLSSGMLSRESWSQARPGDLVFWGSGHEELYTGRWRWTIGAQKSGTRVGFHQWGGWWTPSAVYHVSGAR